jgi:hypothetical protein
MIINRPGVGWILLRLGVCPRTFGPFEHAQAALDQLLEIHAMGGFFLEVRP